MLPDSKSKRTIRILLLLIFILAFILRGAAFMKFKNDMGLEGDARNYWLMSHQLADTGIYGYWYDGNPYGGSPGVSNARVMPGYPLFLTMVYKIVGDKWLQITVTRILQVLIGSLTTTVAFFAMRRIFNRDEPALLTALFIAAYPPYILSSVVLLTEVTALFTMLIYFWIAAAALEARKLWVNLFAGAAFGMHILIRPSLLPMFIMPFVFLLISGIKRDLPRRGAFREKYRNPLTVERVALLFAVQAAGFIFVMAPWWIRNLTTLGTLIITAKGEGNALLAGTYPYWQDFMKDNPESIRGVNDAQREFGIQRIITGLKTDFLLYLKWFTIGKTGYTFEKPYLAYLLPGNRLQHTVHFAVIFSGLPGMIWHAIKNIRGLYFYLYGFLMLCIQLLFVPDPRYAYPLMFFIMAGSSHLLCNLWDLLRNARTSRG